mgnify:CR=1 FL=1
MVKGKEKMSIEIAFPEKILKKLEEISRSGDALSEEIIPEAVLGGKRAKEEDSGER